MGTQSAIPKSVPGVIRCPCQIKAKGGHTNININIFWDSCTFFFFSKDFLTTKNTILLLYYIYMFSLLFPTCCGRAAACLLLMQIKPLWAELNGTETDRQTDRQTAQLVSCNSLDGGWSGTLLTYRRQSRLTLRWDPRWTSPCPGRPTQLCGFSCNAAAAHGRWDRTELRFKYAPK